MVSYQCNYNPCLNPSASLVYAFRISCPWPHFYQTRSAWSVDQGSNKNHSPAYNFAPTVTKFCVMWEGLSLPHDTKFGNCRCKIVDSRAFPIWSLIHGLRWSGLIKAEPGRYHHSCYEAYVHICFCGYLSHKYYNFSQSYICRILIKHPFVILFQNRYVLVSSFITDKELTLEQVINKW